MEIIVSCSKCWEYVTLHCTDKVGTEFKGECEHCRVTLDAIFNP